MTATLTPALCLDLWNAEQWQVADETGIQLPEAEILYLSNMPTYEREFIREAQAQQLES